MAVSPDHLRTFVAERVSVPRSELTASTLLLEDLALDSLALIELAMALETRYGVTLPDDDLFGCQTYGELAALVLAD